MQTDLSVVSHVDLVPFLLEEVREHASQLPVVLDKKNSWFRAHTCEPATSAVRTLQDCSAIAELGAPRRNYRFPPAPQQTCSPGQAPRPIVEFSFKPSTSPRHSIASASPRETCPT